MRKLYLLVGIGIMTTFVGSLWALDANYRTYLQRGVAMRVIGSNGSTDAGWQLMSQYESVSYNEHWIRVLTFRDPWAAYPERLRRIMTI